MDNDNITLLNRIVWEQQLQNDNTKGHKTHKMPAS